MERGLFDDVTLAFDQGTITLSGEIPSTIPTWFERDDRVDIVRAPAVWYKETLRWLSDRRLDYADSASTAQALALRLRTDYKAHPYQREALKAWLARGSCGTIILPTGAGKTFVALGAIAKTGRSTLVVAPTIDLMNQWYALLRDAFDQEIGILGGGYHDIRTITVSTYDSAYIHIPTYGATFDLLVFDEVHHLPSPRNRQIAIMSTARFRLGLTATYERTDGLHDELSDIIGPVVFQTSVNDLKGDYLADFQLIRLSAKLTESESTRYKAAALEYQAFLRSSGIKPFPNGWTELIKMSAYNEDARRALVAKSQMKKLIAGAERKLDVLDMLLKNHPSDKVIIFTEQNDLVYRISQEFLVPAITHETRARERKWILDGFRGSLFDRIVTSKVLNEGIDVPAAKVAVILGGSASPREHLQRLGRILRKGGERSKAILYEVVVSATAETNVSSRRKKNVNA